MQDRSTYLQSDESNETDPLSIDRLTQYIEQALLGTPQLRQAWVTGEVSSATFHPSGIYFTLKDPLGKASIPAVVWKNQIPNLETKPQVGTQVLAFGTISVYAPQGKYQFQVQQVLPIGEGLQALRYEKLKKRLSAEGLFDLDRKRALPKHPRTIAVVTSPTAAAWGDIQRMLLSRYPGLLVLLSPATVQGDTAPSSIERAIDRVIIDGRAEILILARGGGAVEDLSCFDSEIVVRAIAECSIPVVTGIGHERDESLADLAADIRAATPTTAAAVTVPNLEDLIDQHRRRVSQVRVTMAKVISKRQDRLKRLRLRCDRIKPDRQFKLERDRVNLIKQRLKRAIIARIQIAQVEQLSLREQCQALDPRLVLQRGYAVVRQQQGEIVRDANMLTVGDELSVQLGKGEVQVKIIEVHNEK